MENTADSKNKTYKRLLDFGMGQKPKSAPKPSNVEHTQLYLKHSKSRKTITKPLFKVPQLGPYDDPIPQFEPKKFQGKKCSSTITGRSDNKNVVSGSHHSLTESCDTSGPTSVNEAGHVDIQSPSKSDNPDDVGIHLTPEEPQRKKCSSTITGRSGNEDTVPGFDYSLTESSDTSGPTSVEGADHVDTQITSQSDCPDNVGTHQTSEEPGIGVPKQSTVQSIESVEVDVINVRKRKLDTPRQKASKHIFTRSMSCKQFDGDEANKKVKTSQKGVREVAKL